MFRYACPGRGVLSSMSESTLTPTRESTVTPTFAPMLTLVREAHAEFPGVESPAARGPGSGLGADGPVDEADALDELGDEIATLAAHIHAATQRFLMLIADFDRRCGWESGGHRSCAHWLSYRTGIDLGACREKVRTARALETLPETSAAMARGELSFSAVRALSRVATAENEGDLLALAQGCTIAQLERTVRGWKRFNRREEAERERDRHESRSFSVFPDDDGMYVVKGRLPAEVGALLMRALEAASDALYREHPTGAEDSDAQRHKRATQRRADSLALLAECALAAGIADDSAPLSGTRAERYQVVLHVDAYTLSHTLSHTPASEAEPGRSHLEDGIHVSAETSRRLSCDSGQVIMTHVAGGTPTATGQQAAGETQALGGPPTATKDSILSVGRKTRTISPALRRALDFRDRGCRFPGCGLRFADAHHIKHWADGGETSLENCLLVCSHHHRLLHEGGWRVTWWGEGSPCFFDPRGGAHFDGRWTPPELPERPLEAMIAANSRHRAALTATSTAAPTATRTAAPTATRTATTAGPLWKREADIPDDIYFRALEAIA